MVETMKSWKEFSAERVGIMIMLSREGMSQNVVLPWDSDSDEIMGAFVKMLWVAGYPPSWFPEVLRDLADSIEVEFNQTEDPRPAWNGTNYPPAHTQGETAKTTLDETDGKAG